MQEPIISVSGLRGIIGVSLSPELAARFVCAYAAGLPDGMIVVTRDSRTSGPMLARAVVAALSAIGRDVMDAGVAATPTTGVLVRTSGAVGGIQISASHNPSEYNGLKLFNTDGHVLSATDGQQVITRYRNDSPQWVDYSQLGAFQSCDDSFAEHLERVLKTVDVEAIRRREFRVLLDSNHGAGGQSGERLLCALGCQVTLMGGTPDGQFAHPPEPTAANLSGVCATVPAESAVVGFCQDPDADRLALIDETGRYVGEEYTLAICLNHVLRSRPGPVVTNCATSRMSEDIANSFDVPFHRTAVGEANVVAAMREQEAAFGGEGNGGPIDPQVGFVRDSYVGMAQVLDAMAARNESLSTLADELPRYSIHKTTAAVDRTQIADLLATLPEHFADATPDRMDGLRLDWPDRWLLVRASNTEPIVRLIAEAPTDEAAVELCNKAQTVVDGMSA